MNKRENLNKLLKILTKYLNLNITFAIKSFGNKSSIC